METSEQELQEKNNKILAKKIAHILLEKQKCCEHEWKEIEIESKHLATIFGEAMIEIVTRRCEKCGIENQINRGKVYEYSGASSLFLNHRCNHEFVEIGDETNQECDKNLLDCICSDPTLKNELQSIIGVNNGVTIDNERYRITTTPMLCMHCEAEYNLKTFELIQKVNSNPYNLSKLEQQIVQDAKNSRHSLNSIESAINYVMSVLEYRQSYCKHPNNSQWNYIESICKETLSPIISDTYLRYYKIHGGHVVEYWVNENDTTLRRALVNHGCSYRGNKDGITSVSRLVINERRVVECPCCGKIKISEPIFSTSSSVRTWEEDYGREINIIQNYSQFYESEIRQYEDEKNKKVLSLL